MALDASQGEFETRARKMLREHLHEGLIDLANHRDPHALELSMEFAIAHELRWNSIFDESDRQLCLERLKLARGMSKRP